MSVILFPPFLEPKPATMDISSDPTIQAIPNPPGVAQGWEWDVPLDLGFNDIDMTLGRFWKIQEVALQLDEVHDGMQHKYHNIIYRGSSNYIISMYFYVWSCVCMSYIKCPKHPKTLHLVSKL